MFRKRWARIRSSRHPVLTTRCRKSSQKPSDAFYDTFKEKFPKVQSFELDQVCTSTSSGFGTTTTGGDDVNTTQRVVAHPQQPIPGRSASLSKAADMSMVQKSAVADGWPSFGTGFTPSFLDLENSNTFNAFTATMPGYYTPTPGGTHTIYHPQAGDLHTPSLGLGLSTPLSMSTSENPL
jgi:hypothetical protein